MTIVSIDRKTEITQLQCLCHAMFVAGVETTANVAADVTSFTIDGLKSDSTYSVFVSTLSGSREGSPAILNVRTGTTLNLPNKHNRCCPVSLLRDTW